MGWKPAPSSPADDEHESHDRRPQRGAEAQNKPARDGRRSRVRDRHERRVGRKFRHVSCSRHRHLMPMGRPQTSQRKHSTLSDRSVMIWSVSGMISMRPIQQRHIIHDPSLDLPNASFFASGSTSTGCRAFLQHFFYRPPFLFVCSFAVFCLVQPALWLGDGRHLFASVCWRCMRDAAPTKHFEFWFSLARLEKIACGFRPADARHASLFVSKLHT